MVQMLSNIEVILLSIINEKPSYAYEIDKTINLRDMRRWIRIGVASIYQVLKKLEEKDLLFSQTEKEGKMPDRKRYYITDSGKAALIETSKNLLCELEWYYLDLNIGLETSDLLTPGEIADCLTERLARVKANIRRIKEIYSANGNEAQFKRTAVLKTLLYFREAEEHFLEEVLQEISAHR